MIANQLRNLFIKPVLLELAKYRSSFYTPEAIELLMGTASQESHLKYWKQLENGPALSLFQIEPATAQDNYDNYLNYRPELKEIVDKWANPNMKLKENLLNSLPYAIAHARVWYYRQSGAIPKDLKGQAEYYKKNYNTYEGKATIQEYLNNYEKYCS